MVNYLNSEPVTLAPPTGPPRRRKGEYLQRYIHDIVLSREAIERSSIVRAKSKLCEAAKRNEHLRDKRSEIVEVVVVLILKVGFF